MGRLIVAPSGKGFVGLGTVGYGGVFLSDAFPAEGQSESALSKRDGDFVAPECCFPCWFGGKQERNI